VKENRQGETKHTYMEWKKKYYKKKKRNVFSIVIEV